VSNGRNLDVNIEKLSKHLKQKQTTKESSLIIINTSPILNGFFYYLPDYNAG
jgi:hypothetical protein